jgi:hypothetical protein
MPVSASNVHLSDVGNGFVSRKICRPCAHCNCETRAAFDSVIRGKLLLTRNKAQLRPVPWRRESAAECGSVSVAVDAPATYTL